MANTRSRKVEPSVETTSSAPAKEGRLHRASYAADKKNPGKWFIRVSGPSASKFAGREVPVSTKSGDEHMELLDKGIWAGPDQETGEPVCLYTFVAKPKEMIDEELPF